MRIAIIIQQMKSNLYQSFLMGLLSFYAGACGIEAGNPTEPVPNQPKVEEVPNEPKYEEIAREPTVPQRVEIRYLVENQYDEAITSLLEFSATSEVATALALVGGADTSTCAEQADGSLDINHQETDSNTRSSGIAPDLQEITEVFGRVFSSKMQNTGTNLRCSQDNTKPNLDWSVLATLNIDGNLERSNSRSIVNSASGELVRDSNVKSSGVHQTLIKKISYNSTTGIQLAKTLTFGTDLAVTTKIGQAEPTLLKTRIDTLATDKLSIEETYNANFKLKSMKIISGAVSSSKGDGMVVVLRYMNTVLETELSCRPTSGTVTGEVYKSNDLTKIIDTFSVRFGTSDNFIVYADGSVSKLEFEPCRIETTQSDSSRNNGGRAGGGRR